MVPKEIREVKRPVNTVVIDQGGDGPRRFAVKERKRVKYISGGYPQPINGKVIGHICDGRFVPPGKALTSSKNPLVREWGLAAFIRSVSFDVADDLCKCFEIMDAYKIPVMAMLRIMRHRLPANRFQVFYKKSFVSVCYPGIPLSSNTISSFLNRLGGDVDKIRDFARCRLSRVSADHRIAIDGTLKTDDSVVNNLSDWSHKARVRGVKEISLLYAYNIDLMEPLFCHVVGGNTIDSKALLRFIDRNNLTRGIIVADKGFELSQIRDYLKEHPQLHYLLPLKRNNRLIREHKMTSDYQQGLTGEYAGILGKKVQLKDGRYLYSFSDLKREAAEKDTARTKVSLRQSQKDLDKYNQNQDMFGVIVFISDCDFELQLVYHTYRQRWLLEMTFALFKGDLGLSVTAVQDEYSVRGSEFVNFIAALLASRMLRKAEETGLLNHMTFGALLEDLSDADRRSDAPNTKPVRYDKYWEFEREDVYDIMEKLDLIEPVTFKSGTRKPGRPKKESADNGESAGQSAEPEQKRRRGRPRIHPLPDEDAPKRKRGRPRKNPPPDENAPKKKRGRPRIHPLPDENAPKRKRGRPKKQSSDTPDLGRSNDQ